MESRCVMCGKPFQQRDGDPRLWCSVACNAADREASRAKVIAYLDDRYAAADKRVMERLLKKEYKPELISIELPNPSIGEPSNN